MAGGATGSAPPVRPVQVWALTSLVFVVVVMLNSVHLVVVQMVGMGSLVVLSFLEVLRLMLNMRMGEIIALSLRGAMVHGLPFVAFVLLQRDGSDFLVVVSFQVEMVGWVQGLVFVVVALIGVMIWFVLTPLWSKWLGTGFTLLVLTQC
jgi:hypothetical protein